MKIYMLIVLSIIILVFLIILRVFPRDIFMGKLSGDMKDN